MSQRDISKGIKEIFPEGLFSRNNFILVVCERRNRKYFGFFTNYRERIFVDDNTHRVV